MSHCLSNLSAARPMSPQATPFSSNLNSLHSRFTNMARIPIISGRKSGLSGVKVMSVQGNRDNHNIDPLQRPLTQQAQKRSAPVAPLGSWDRYPTAKTVQQMLETMERMMDDPLTYNNRWPSPTDTVEYSRGRTPWEIMETETEYKTRFDMPGMSKEDVKVWVEERMLVVKAEKVIKKKKSGNEEEGGGEEWTAKSYGRYSSRIALPENVDFEKIKAEVKDGVLYITIPKASNGAKVFDISVV